MKLTVPFVALLLVGCAQSPAPAPVAAVEATPPPPPGFVEIPAGYRPVPTKGEFIAEQSAGITPEAQAQIDAANAKIQAQRARDDAEWEANKRTERIVQAQEETTRAVERVAERLD